MENPKNKLKPVVLFHPNSIVAEFPSAGGVAEGRGGKSLSGPDQH
jgi:hypothetical protein